MRANTRAPSMGRRQVRDYDEQDVYTTWRKAYCYTQRPGVVKAIKRKTHKRERRGALGAILESLNS